jgi:hypothetical protein
MFRANYLVHFRTLELILNVIHLSTREYLIDKFPCHIRETK